nr:glutamine synthetase III [Fusobacteriaceae bacterium]
MKNQLELYGINYFSDQELKNRVSEGVYKEFQKVKRRTQELSLETADAIANAVKMWAIDNGATHFTHWFQPLTEATAEKHDSFIAINPNGIVMPQFSGKD